MLNEKQLIEGCVRQDKLAQKMLYEKYASSLLGICMRYAQDKPEAEDILQEGFLKIFLRIKQYSGEGSFEGWMKRIMVNTAISNYRKQQKHYYQQDINDVNESDMDVDSVEPDTAFSRNELLKIIQDLPPGYRVVFNLFAVEGYKHKEIAEILNIDETTSKSQFSRARKLIQKRLHEISRIKLISG